MLDESLKTSAHPGVVYRSGPAGRRAGLAGGPDVWEAINAVRHAQGSGEQKIVEVTAQLGVPERLVRVAVSFAASYPEEIETLIAAMTQWWRTPGGSPRPGPGCSPREVPDRRDVRGAAEDRVIVTENAVDFVTLLDTGLAADLTVPPVIIAVKRMMPCGAGAMSHHLAERLDAWASAHPIPTGTCTGWAATEQVAAVSTSSGVRRSGAPPSPGPA